MGEERGIAGLILAGGSSRRMGENKGLLRVGGERLMDRVRYCLEGHVDVLALNGDREVWKDEDCVVIEDVMVGGEGPLVGIVSGLMWAEGEGKEWLVTVPLDTPFLPEDMVLRLREGVGEGGASCARSGGRHHPVVGCWHVSWRERVEKALGEGVRKIDSVFEEGERLMVEVGKESLGGGDFYDPLMNVNRRDDLEEAERIERCLIAMRGK